MKAHYSEPHQDCLVDKGLLWLVVAAIIVSYEKEFIALTTESILAVKTFWLNCVLWTMSYLAYRKLIKDMRALGLDCPDFHFTPVQSRD